MKFTERYIKGIKPKTSSYRIFEKGADKGFGIKVTPAGSRSFFIQYATNGKQRFYNLGRYPSVSLSEAREHCRETRSAIDRGVDPQRHDEQHFGTVKDLFDYYIQSMQEAGKKTGEKVRADLSFNCSELLNLPANEIRPAHIRKILHSIIARGSEVQSNRVRSYLRRAFQLGIHHDNDPKNLKNTFNFNLSSNPVDAIPKNPAAESVGERNLSFDEIKLLWNSDKLSPQFGYAVKLLLLYGCRPWELMGASKQEFDFDSLLWSLPPERVKNGRWHLLPITPIAKKLLEGLWFYSRGSAYLFPGRYDETKPVSRTSLKNATDRVNEIERFVPRDLRRTVKTRMGEVGIDKSIRDRLQNHALDDVSSKHYDRYDYLNEKKAALLLWEEKLYSIVGPGL